MSSDALFGAPLLISPTARDDWSATLVRDWTTQMGRPPQSLTADLADLSSLFATGAKPKLIRDRVHGLPAVDHRSEQLPSAACLIVDGCALVTPEGRILLDVLRQLQASGSTRISPDQHIRALDAAATLRQQWHTVWLRKQFQGSLSAPTLGAALFLLLNGSIGEPQALFLPSDDRDDRELGALVLPLIATFSGNLGGRKPDTTSGIRQHWAFTQLSRLLGRQINRKPVSDGTITYVRTGQDSALLDELVLRLEQAADPHQRREATLQLWEGYREIRGVLAAYGQMHEDPTATRRVLARLADPVAIT